MTLGTVPVCATARRKPSVSMMPELNGGLRFFKVGVERLWNILNDRLEWFCTKINNCLEWYLLFLGGYGIIFV